MNITESIRLSFESLKSNKLRSFLTMLGIIIGISAVITITTIGNSLQKTIASTMRELGGTNLSVRSRRNLKRMQSGKPGNIRK